MDILLQRRDPALPAGSGIFASDAAPFGHVLPHTLASLLPEQRALGANGFIPSALPGVNMLALTRAPSPRIVLLGAEPDAKPVADLASFMGWSVTVIDHRPHYDHSERFPHSESVLAGGPPALADSDLPYVGLLRPASRRDRLLSQLGASAARLRTRLHSPFGLEPGADTPEAIALAIMSEMQGHLAGRGRIESLSAQIESWTPARSSTAPPVGR